MKRMMQRLFAMILSMFSVMGAAMAATPEQAERARSCDIAQSTITTSIKLETVLGRFDSEITHGSKGAATDDAIQIIEFFDYSCPGCMALHPALDKYLHDNPDVRLDLVEYPIYGRTMISRATGNKTLTATHVAFAAREQGKYIPFHDTLFSRGGRPDKKKIKWAAEIAGLDYDVALRRAKDKDIQNLSDQNLAYANELGILGTPAMIVDGIILSAGPWRYSDVGCLVREARSARAARP